MLKFTSYLTEAKNTHMEHLEDLVFLEGIDGTRKAIQFLRSMRDMLAGHSNGKVTATVKWDGCVHEDTIILTNRGDMSIKDIVDHEEYWGEMEIMGHNFNGVVWPYDGCGLLIAGHKSEGDKKWVEVELEDSTIIKVTEDHEFHTSNRGWVPANQLTENDDVTEM